MTARPLGRTTVLAFVAVALLLAGVLSYFASSSPDGLESVLARGCENPGGSCLAQSSTDHAFADGTLADYAVSGDSGLTGVAGVLGVAATLLVASGLFWLLRRRSG